MKIEKGMFIQAKTLLIYLEIDYVADNFVVCASRDPKEKTDIVFLSDIEKCVEVPPKGASWIKMNREKNFYDKFCPEGWQGEEVNVLKIEDIKKGDLVVTEKGVVQADKKISDKKWKTKGAQSSISKSHYFVIFKKEGLIGQAYSRD